ncbi:MAG: FAD-dependent thymidylate synthase [Candidatus Diapherotrites archaeon]|nr:FAD-dependent thymidylate synthase [Candidatus Diapherotrites archaeon]
MKVKLIRYTPEPELTAATAAHLCYAGVDIDKLQKKITREYAEKLLKHVIESGHWSVLEHVSFTFAIEGISRACSHQLVRHRIASYSQQSQRYVNEENFNYILPKSIADNKKFAERFRNFMDSARDFYAEMIANGIPKEDARFVLPNATETRIIVTMNTRSLYNFFEKRLCMRAQWEIRALANKMLKLCRKVAPLLFKNAGPICERLGYCPEAKSCGRYPTKEEVLSK